MEQVLAELRALRDEVKELKALVATPRAELLTPDQAAKAMGLKCTKTVRRLVKSGKLRTVKVGKRWRVPLSEVQRFAVPATRGPSAPRTRTEAAAERPEDVLRNVVARQRRGA